MFGYFPALPLSVEVCSVSCFPAHLVFPEGNDCSHHLCSHTQMLMESTVLPSTFCQLWSFPPAVRPHCRALPPPEVMWYKSVSLPAHVPLYFDLSITKNIDRPGCLQERTLWKKSRESASTLCAVWFLLLNKCVILGGLTSLTSHSLNHFDSQSSKEHCI